MTNGDVVLVTGGTGFLARHTILRLLGRGHRVRASVRSEHKGNQLRGVIAAAGGAVEQLDTVTADLLDPQAWPRAMDGVSHVLHMAAAMQGSDIRAAALDGTRIVLETAAEAGAKRVVVTSTGLAALWPKRAPAPGEPLTEADWTDTDAPGLDTYTRAKTLAERDAWQRADTLGLSLSTILPGVIMGPVLGPERSVWQGLVADMLAGKLPALPPINLQMVDVRDVADLHIAALLAPEAGGQRYIAAGERLSLSAVAAIMKAELAADTSKSAHGKYPLGCSGLWLWSVPRRGLACR